jgi:hypothetical protein
VLRWEPLATSSKSPKAGINGVRGTRESELGR